jgi:hypothetical protein
VFNELSKIVNLLSEINMKHEVMTLDELLGSIIRTEFFEVVGPGVDRLKQILSSYNGGRLSENYSTSHVDNMLSSGRFKYGAVITYVNDEPVCFCGLDLVDGWVSITRHLVFKYLAMPFGSGEMIPFIFNMIKDDYNGLMFTFNECNKTLFDHLTQDSDKRFRRPIFKPLRDQYLFTKSLETSSMIKTMDGLVMYNNTPQYVAYITNKDVSPRLNKIQD